MQAVIQRQEGIRFNHKKVYRMMKILGLKAIYPGINTTKRNHKEMVHPNLLKDYDVQRPHEAWQTDITYLRTNKGFIYLASVIDHYSRAILSYRISNSLDSLLVINAISDGVSWYGAPLLIHSDQGSQYTGKEWQRFLKQHDIKCSMSGQGRSNDNAEMERYFRTLKYEWLFIKCVREVSEFKAEIKQFHDWYNHDRPHQALGYRTPAEMLATI